MAVLCLGCGLCACVVLLWDAVNLCMCTIWCRESVKELTVWQLVEPWCVAYITDSLECSYLNAARANAACFFTAAERPALPITAWHADRTPADEARAAFLARVPARPARALQPLKATPLWSACISSAAHDDALCSQPAELCLGLDAEAEAGDAAAAVLGHVCRRSVQLHGVQDGLACARLCCRVLPLLLGSRDPCARASQLFQGRAGQFRGRIHSTFSAGALGVLP